MSLLICFLTVSLVLRKFSRWLVSDDLAGVGAGCRCAGLAGCRCVWLWCWLDVLPNSLKRHQRQLKGNEHSIHIQQLWWTFLETASQLHTPSKCATSVALCCVDETAHFRECVYCDQPEAPLCTNHAVYFIIVLIINFIPPGRWMDCLGKGGVLTDIDLCA